MVQKQTPAILAALKRGLDITLSFGDGKNN